MVGGSPPIGEASGRGPVIFHAVSLSIAAIMLVWTAKGLQFYWDDWAIISALSRGDFSVPWLMNSHNEHWILLPKLVFSLLHVTLGFGSVWPYIAITLMLHLLLCHLLWRLAIRGGADPWLTGWASLGFALYAAGIENIFFVIPMGVVANMVLGTATLLELNRPRPRPVVIVLLSTVNVVTYSLAPVFLVLSGVSLVVQRRIRLAWTLVPPGTIYALWFLLERPSVPGQPHSSVDVLLVPLYWMLGVGNAISSAVPWRSPEAANMPGLQPVSAFLAFVGVCVLVGILTTIARRPDLRPGWVVTVFFLGCPGLVAVSSLSKVSFGLGYAMLPRYTYIGTAFLLPFLLVFLTRAMTRRRVRRAAVMTAAAAVALANVVAWPGVAGERVRMTRESARTLAAGQNLANAGRPLYREMAGTPAFGFLTPEDLSRLDLSQVAGEITRADELSAVLSAQVRVIPGGAPVSPCGPTTSAIDAPLESAPFTINVSRTTTVALSINVDGGDASHAWVTRLGAGAHDVSSLVDQGTLVVRELDGGASLVLCER